MVLRNQDNAFCRFLRYPSSFFTQLGCHTSRDAKKGAGQRALAGFAAPCTKGRDDRESFSSPGTLSLMPEIRDADLTCPCCHLNRVLPSRRICSFDWFFR